MRSWPTVYIPPAPEYLTHPDLMLLDSYTQTLQRVNQPLVSSYVCGITPYDATHLGHAATYISFDLIHRYIIASGRTLAFVENITDIDDPLLERAARDQQDWQSLAQSQIDLFISDMTALRIIPPNSYRGVVESMDEIVTSINLYINKGVTYEIAGDIYLDISKVSGYPNNLPMSFEEAKEVFAQRGGDPERPGKKAPLDPLLWRAKRAGEPSWPAPFGAGRPGWHVECVAIALQYLPDAGETSITLQGGGSDLIFPHHYMSAMQSKAITGKSFAGVYVHAGMIGLDGEKMSKSKGNLVFVSKLLEQGVPANQIRLALLLNHYQSDRMWSEHLLDQAGRLIEKLSIALSMMEVASTKDVIVEFVSALANNLDTPKAISVIEQWCDRSISGESGGQAGEVARALDTYLGIAL